MSRFRWEEDRHHRRSSHQHSRDHQPHQSGDRGIGSKNLAESELCLREEVCKKTIQDEIQPKAFTYKAGGLCYLRS